MSRKIILESGTKFGKWEIVKEKEDDPKKYFCRCECGKMKEVWKSHLIYGKTKGCSQCSAKRGSEHHQWNGCGEIHGAVFAAIFNERGRKSRREIEANITIEYVWDLFLKQDRKCALSGLPIKFSEIGKPNKQYPQTASLDRIDGSKGYVEGNVQWVHKDVNRMKNVFTDERFIEICQAVAKKHLACTRKLH